MEEHVSVEMFASVQLDSTEPDANTGICSVRIAGGLGG